MKTMLQNLFGGRGGNSGDSTGAGESPGGGGRGRAGMFGLLKAVLALVVVCYALWTAFKWTVMRVYVPPHQALLVINKFGKSLPPEYVTVPPGPEWSGFKGVREELLGPGRYFLDPIRYDWELVDLIEIKAGEPERWDWDPHGKLKNPATAPEIGVVSKMQGKAAEPGQEVVDPEFKGIQREVLTPGTYKLNKKVYQVTKQPAVVIPPGSVGVVTDLSKGRFVPASAVLAPTTTATAAATAAATAPAAPAPVEAPAAPAGRILAEVLQPGIYYLNPRLFKVDVVPVGFDVITLEAPRDPVRFISADGYQVEADFTVVWGRTPKDAPYIVANIGDIDRVEKNVIEPAMSSMCRNVGAIYTARQLIEGESRVKFQDDLVKALKEQVKSRNVEILLALVRNISVKDTGGKDATGGLLTTIQKANIEYEKDLTNKQKTLTATASAELEQWLREVDVARQKVTSETNVKVAKLEAEGIKEAAQIDAERDKAVATIALQMAEIDAQRTRAMGKATADVERMKREAEAKGAKLLIDAFGSPQAYNQYIFAKSFEPDEIRLIFAGPGTFWTDLKNFQDVGAAKVIQPQAAPTPRRAAPAPQR